jgi:nitrite reductase (NO-forming)
MRVFDVLAILYSNLMYLYLLFTFAAWTIGLLTLVWLILQVRKARKFTFLKEKRVFVPLLVLLGACVLGILGSKTYPPSFAMPAWMHSMAPGGMSAALPLGNAFSFFWHANGFERVPDISADPNDVPPPLTRTAPQTVELKLTAKEVISEVAPNIFVNYWTYNGQVPGPMMRVRVGDTIVMTLSNDSSSLHGHNLDLHAVNGPGGGAVYNYVEPGETKTFTWKALNPGLYIYHCASMNVSVHNAHGQYGLILVEPEGGLPKVDREFYLVQGELYEQGGLGHKGLVAFDPQALLDGNPTYVTFNGRVEQTNRMKVKRGERVRLYVGNGGVNLVSSLHLIGEIFDTVYPEGAIGEGSTILKNVQTTLIPAGGATIVEFNADVPGTYLLVDHALSRLNKGAWATIEVRGEPNPEIFSSQEKLSAPMEMN